MTVSNYMIIELCRHHVELMAATPGYLQQILFSPLLQNSDLSSVKTLLCAGANLPPSIVRGLKKSMGNALYISEGITHFLLSLMVLSKTL